MTLGEAKSKETALINVGLWTWGLQKGVNFTFVRWRHWEIRWNLQ